MPASQLWLPARAFQAVSGATGPFARGTDTDPIRKTSVYVFPDAGGIVTTTFILPTDWNLGPVTVTYHWVKEDAGSNNVAWEWIWAQVNQGDQVDQVAGTPLSTVAAVPAAIDALARTQIGTSFAPAGYRTIRGAVKRSTTGDTYTGDVYLLGVELGFTVD